jgi:hypothetical protein
MCITQLAHGVDKIFYHIWHTRANRDIAARIFFEYGGAPRKIAATQAAMAYFLGPSPEFVRAVDLGEDTSCYLFRNEAGLDGGKPVVVAVAWHHYVEDTIAVPEGVEPRGRRGFRHRWRTRRSGPAQALGVAGLSGHRLTLARPACAGHREVKD